MLSGGVTGGLALEVVLAHGVVRTAWLRSKRPVALSQTMVGRPAEQVPAAFERLYALCGRSHRIAARLALDAARGRDATKAARQAAVRDLAAERVGEHLRSTFATALAVGLPFEPGEIETLRAAFVATRPGAPRIGLDAALALLGLGGTPPLPASWAARMLGAVGPETAAGGTVDALSADDDPAVLASLAAAGGEFAARPHLPLRRPETGALARASGTDTPHDRLAARFAEIRHAAALLRDGAGSAPDSWIASGTLPDRTGFAVVETPRGRMHHLVAVDAHDRVASCAVLAPTEWNFHPDGPFVRRLPGLHVGTGGAAAARIRWLIGLFDPCVACAVNLTEGADA